MPNNDLTLDIKATASGALNVFEKLKKVLVETATACDGMTKSFASSAIQIAASMKVVKESSEGFTRRFRAIAKAVRETDFGNVQANGLYQAGQAMRNIALSMGSIANGNGVKNIQSAATALGGMAQSIGQLSGNATKLNDLASGLKKLPDALGKFGHGRGFADGIKGFSEAMFGADGNSGLNAELAKINSNGAQNISRIGQGLKDLASVDASGIANIEAAADPLHNFISKATAGVDSVQIAATANAIKTFVASLKNLSGASLPTQSLEAIATSLDRFLFLAQNSAYAADTNAIKNIVSTMRSLTNAAAYMAGIGDNSSGMELGVAKIVGQIEDMFTRLSGIDPSQMTMVGWVSKGLGSLMSGLRAAGKLSDADIVGKMTSISTGIRRFFADMSGTNLGNVENVVNALVSVKSALARVNNLSTKDNGALTGNIERAAAALRQFISTLSSFTDAQVEKFTRVAQACRDAADAVRSLNAAQRAADKQSGKGSKVLGELSHLKGGLGDLTGSINSVVSAAPGLGRVVAVLNLISSAVEGVKKAFKEAVDFIKKFVKAAQKAAKNVQKAFKGFSKKFSIAEDFKKAFGAVSRVVRYRLIRGALRAIATAAKEGLENLYYYSTLLNNMDAGKANSSLNELATTALYVKNSFGAALMPVINALLPLINMLANAFAAAANAVNALFSALRGLGTFTAAKRSATEYADALKGAGGSAKELRATLLGFDEINRLDDNNGGGGGGGAGALDYADMFEELPIPDFISRLIDMVKAGKWKQLSFELTAKLEETIGNIKWSKLGTTFGKYFGGAVSVLGNTIGALDWVNLGGKIAEFFNNTLREINLTDGFTALARITTAKFRILVETIGGFLASIDPMEAAKGFTSYITGLLDSIIDVIRKTPWSEIKDSIVTFITNIDWKEIFSKISELISLINPAEVLIAVIDILSLLPWTEIVSSIETWFEGLDWNSIKDKMKEMLTSPKFTEVIQGLVDVISGLPFGDICAALAQGIGQAMGSVSWGGLIQALLEGYISAKTFSLNIWFNAITGRNLIGGVQGGGNPIISIGNNFAGGGFPDAGSMFVAGEAGPEFVGNIGGRTGVMNTDQMAASVAEGNARVETLLAQLIAAVNNKDFDVTLDGKSIAVSTTKYQHQMARAAG